MKFNDTMIKQYKYINLYRLRGEGAFRSKVMCKMSGLMSISEALDLVFQ